MGTAQTGIKRCLSSTEKGGVRNALQAKRKKIMMLERSGLKLNDKAGSLLSWKNVLLASHSEDDFTPERPIPIKIDVFRVFYMFLWHFLHMMENI